MTEEQRIPILSALGAEQLAEPAKTAAQFDALTPKWLPKLLEWKPLAGGIFRLNKVNQGITPLDILFQRQKQADITMGAFDYQSMPREYKLRPLSLILNVPTAISDTYSHPHDQIKEQLRLGMESLKEKQESELLNNDDYGLLKNIAAEQKIKTRTGVPTPDDMDELIYKVWKEPSFFLAHPRAIAAFGRECTRRGVPPATVNLFGTPFLTWRGIPIIPTDKLLVDGQRRPTGSGGKTGILLLRSGEKKQGVLGLYQESVPGEQAMGLSVKCMGLDQNGTTSYLLSLYCSAAILAEDAVGLLEDVDVGNYYVYNN